MKKLVLCTNTDCPKLHCLCHPFARHWIRTVLINGEPEQCYFDSKTPCDGYISRIERSKYGIKLN